MNKYNSDEVIVKFENVTKKYGDLVVLDKLNLEIKKNEMVSIIGPSGSGKTTVLRVLMTLEKINGGVIYLDGEPLTHVNSNGSFVEASEKYLREQRLKQRELEKIRKFEELENPSTNINFDFNDLNIDKSKKN